MVHCIACGAEGASEVRLATYDENALGLPVTLKNAALHHTCPSCGYDGIEIPDFDGLEAAVAVARLLLPIALNGPEIRFLRHACGLKAKEFASACDFDPSTLSRWEHCMVRGEGIGSVTDRTIRDAVWGFLHQRVPAFSVEPGHFSRMKLRTLAEGEEMPRIMLERIRLKECGGTRKSDEWDLCDEAA